MSALRLRALLQKEWRDMLRNKMVLLSVIIAPLILLSVSVFMLVLFNGSYEELARLNYAGDFEREHGERLGGKKLPLLPGPHDHGLPRSRASGCDPGDELAAAPSQADRRSGGQAVGSIGITDRQSA